MNLKEPIYSSTLSSQLDDYPVISQKVSSNGNSLPLKKNTTKNKKHMEFSKNVSEYPHLHVQEKCLEGRGNIQTQTYFW